MSARRGFAVYLIASLAMGLVAVLFTASTLYSLGLDGYPWDSGELTADIVTIVAALSLALAAGWRALHHAHRLDAFREEPNGDLLRRQTADWLPQASAGDRVDWLDLDEQTKRLRGLATRATIFGAVFLLCFAAAFFLPIAAGKSAQQLLNTGTRVPGQVESVHQGKSKSIMVGYRTLGAEEYRSVSIKWTSSPRYAPGDAVTVVYDPADPSRVRTTGEENFTELTTIAPAALLFVAAVLGVPVSLLAAGGWRRRYRAVRATGWRCATATLTVTEGSRSRKKYTLIRVGYADGSGVELANAVSLHAAKGPAGQVWEVWVGGVDEDMTVLYPHGRWRAKPLAVPGKGVTPRG